MPEFAVAPFWYADADDGIVVPLVAASRFTFLDGVDVAVTDVVEATDGDGDAGVGADRFTLILAAADAKELAKFSRCLSKYAMASVERERRRRWRMAEKGKAKKRAKANRNERIKTVGFGSYQSVKSIC